jgi:hypothetical protein
MLRAVIRSGREVFHFSGELSGYNLQTLRQHIRKPSEAGTVHLRIQIEPSDEEAFGRYSSRWLPELAKSGAVIELRAPHKPSQMSIDRTDPVEETRHRSSLVP